MVDELVANNWRYMDNANECFLMGPSPSHGTFMKLKIRTFISYLDLFHRFIPKSMVQRLVDGFSLDDSIIGTRGSRAKGVTPRARKKNRVPVVFKISLRYVYQSIAVYIKLLGQQSSSTENKKNKNNYASCISECINFFSTLSTDPKHKCVGRTIVMRLLSSCLFTGEYADDICLNFQSLVMHLGHAIAGDEKLFYFTGESGNVIFVPSKPGKYGFWFYQLCGSLNNGLPYCLKFELKDNANNKVYKILDITKKWVDVIYNVGSEYVPPGTNPNPYTYLASDSYYTDNAVRKFLLEDKPDIRFTCSVRGDRFPGEVRMVHPEEDRDKTGQWKGITNDTTGECFVYHYDTQKGVGKKYNYSRGFIRSVDKYKVKEHSNRIPCYDYYKTMFESCDRFNRNLHDRVWPYKRGGKGTLGEAGHHHDFIMATVVQNIFNAYHSINTIEHRFTDFKYMCDQLSTDIFNYSLSN